MNLKKEYDLKRNNFIEKIKNCFEFLVLDFGYDIPVYKKYEQSNGTIIRDEFVFVKKNKTIRMLNAYHPADYGFEIFMQNIETAKEDLLYYELKEKQDINQNYLKNIAILLKNEYKDKL